MALIDVQVPDIGDFDEVAVIEVLVNVGDTVAVDQSLVTVESDKASMEIPSSHAGVVKAMTVKLGDKVTKGSVLLQVEGRKWMRPSQQRLRPQHTPQPHQRPRSAVPAAAAQERPRWRSMRPAIPTATCWFWAVARVAIRLRSVPPTGLKSHCGGALCHDWGRLLECWLYPIQGAVARGGGDGRGQAL